MIHFKFNFAIALIMTLICCAFSPFPIEMRNMGRYLCLRYCLGGLSQEFSDLKIDGMDCAKHGIKNMIKTESMNKYLLYYYESFYGYFFTGSVPLPSKFCSEEYNLDMEMIKYLITLNEENLAKVLQTYKISSNFAKYNNCLNDLEVFGTKVKKTKVKKTPETGESSYSPGTGESSYSPETGESSYSSGTGESSNSSITDEYEFEFNAIRVLVKAFYLLKQGTNKDEIDNVTVFAPGSHVFKYLDCIAISLTLKDPKITIPSPETLCDEECVVKENNT